MNKQKLEEDIKKRRINPYISNSYTDLPSVSVNDIAIFDKQKNSCCPSPKKYKNGIGKMVFWSCKSCGADLGDIND
jgi:ribosomal protein L37AE/L43A